MAQAVLREPHTGLNTGNRDQISKIKWANLGVGAVLQVFQVTSLGQPLENIKTYVAANRQASLVEAVKNIRSRGLFQGFYQGLVPWAWWEATTKGAILILASSEAQRSSRNQFNLSPAVSATVGGVAGGAAQAYLVMGMTTCMKTIEVTRSKTAAAGERIPGTMEVFANILRTQGIRGINKGVNAVALRQVSGWASRMGIASFTEGRIRKLRGVSVEKKLAPTDKIAASVIGGILSCWNQPFEVVRVEMQAMKSADSKRLSMAQTAKQIFHENGVMGFFKGVVPRSAVAAWATVCMVGLGDQVKEAFGTK